MIRVKRSWSLTKFINFRKEYNIYRVELVLRFTAAVRVRGQLQVLGRLAVAADAAVGMNVAASVILDGHGRLQFAVRSDAGAHLVSQFVRLHQVLEVTQRHSAVAHVLVVFGRCDFGLLAQQLLALTAVRAHYWQLKFLTAVHQRVVVPEDYFAHKFSAMKQNLYFSNWLTIEWKTFFKWDKGLHYSALNLSFDSICFSCHCGSYLTDFCLTVK